MKIENHLMQANRDVEHQKGSNEQTRFVLEELKKQVETEENELKKLESDLHHNKSEVLKKGGAVDSLLKKLEQLTSKTGVCVSYMQVAKELGLLASCISVVPHSASDVKNKDTIAALRPQSPVLVHDNHQHKSHKPHVPPISVT